MRLRNSLWLRVREWECFFCALVMVGTTYRFLRSFLWHERTNLRTNQRCSAGRAMDWRRSPWGKFLVIGSGIWWRAAFSFPVLCCIISSPPVKRRRGHNGSAPPLKGYMVVIEESVGCSTKTNNLFCLLDRFRNSCGHLCFVYFFPHPHLGGVVSFSSQ